MRLRPVLLGTVSMPALIAGMRPHDRAEWLELREHMQRTIIISGHRLGLLRWR